MDMRISYDAKLKMIVLLIFKTFERKINCKIKWSKQCKNMRGKSEFSERLVKKK